MDVHHVPTFTHFLPHLYTFLILIDLGQKILDRKGSIYGFFVRRQNFSVYILIDLEAMQPKPPLR